MLTLLIHFFEIPTIPTKNKKAPRCAGLFDKIQNVIHPFRGFKMAGAKGLEPSAFCVTGRRYNQLNYAPNNLKEAKI